MKTIVTGGAGFIGHHLVKALRERGDEVEVIDNYASGKLHGRKISGITYYEVDVVATSSDTSLERIFEGADHVFHLAALPRVQYSLEYPAETERVNVGGTLSVLAAARKTGVRRVVFASSSSVYGEPNILPLSESLRLNPMSPYAQQKASAEWYCRFYGTELGLSTVSLRFFNVYGPGADPNGPYALVVAKFIEQRLKSEPMTITGDGTQTRDFTHVSDVVKAMLFAAESPNVGRGEAINIGGGKKISVNEVAAAIGGPVVHIAPRLEPHDTLADISRAKELLGWEPQALFEEGVAELKVLHGLT